MKIITIWRQAILTVLQVFADATLVFPLLVAATFARDAAILSQAGWRLARVTPIDQFVYSAHVELVGVFER